MSFLTLSEFCSKAGLNMDDIPSIPEGRYRPDLEDMKGTPIVRSEYDGLDVLVLAVKGAPQGVVTSLKGNPTYDSQRGVLMIFFRTLGKRYRSIVGIDNSSLYTWMSGTIGWMINQYHDESPQHRGGSLDVCPNCFLVNDYWKVDELVKIVRGSSEYLKLLN